MTLAKSDQTAGGWPHDPGENGGPMRVARSPEFGPMRLVIGNARCGAALESRSRTRPRPRRAVARNERLAHGCLETFHPPRGATDVTAARELVTRPCCGPAREPGGSPPRRCPTTHAPVGSLRRHGSSMPSRPLATRGEGEHWMTSIIVSGGHRLATSQVRTGPCVCARSRSRFETDRRMRFAEPIRAERSRSSMHAGVLVVPAKRLRPALLPPVARDAPSARQERALIQDGAEAASDRAFATTACAVFASLAATSVRRARP